MTIKPIIFNAPMVRATLEDRKRQTRRVINSVLGIGRVTEFQRSDTRGYDWIMRDSCGLWNDLRHASLLLRCPYGQVGDVLWVRESFATFPLEEPHAGPTKWDIRYAADGGDAVIMAPHGYNPMLYNYERWSPSIHMPMWAARIWLRVTNVRVERVQGISGADARAEGCPDKYVDGVDQASIDALSREWFSGLWDSINAARGCGWDVNPWVWVVDFERCEKPAEVEA